MLRKLVGSSDCYQIKNSIILDAASSQYLSRSHIYGTSQADTSVYKKTLSIWTKRGKLGTVQELISSMLDGNNYWQLLFNSDDTLVFNQYQGGAEVCRKVTTAVYRDPTAHLHIQLVINTTLATAGARIKLFINGKPITSFSASTDPTQNLPIMYLTPTVSGTYYARIGNRADNTYHYDGYLSDFAFVDGQALGPEGFGRFCDKCAGRWEPIRYSGTFGNNGFRLEFKNPTTLGADTSGNGNNWTLNNVTSANQTIDTPTNNFCVLNPLDARKDGGSTQRGNTYWQTDNVNVATYGTSIFRDGGKWNTEISGIGVGIGGTFLCRHLPQ
jgi:hypothetical protein